MKSSIAPSIGISSAAGLGLKPKICFVAHFAYGALTGKTDQHIGGVEQQQSLLAKCFARLGYSVSMLTWDQGGRDGEVVDGVTVYKICPQQAGVRGLRFIYPRWIGLCDAMSRADADVYYQNCGECETGQVAAWCRLHKRKFIYSVANDSDVDFNLPEMQTMREKILYRFGLKRANRVIAQTYYQQKRLKNDWKIDSTVIPMPCCCWSAKEYKPPPSFNFGNTRILWIGRFARQKRFDWLIQMASSCPDLTFDVVGQANDDSDYSRKLEAQARSLSNLTYHGFVEREQLYDIYRSSFVLLSTSRFEGFPNTFLEAWSLGLPVVSTFDPDNLIKIKKLGCVADDLFGLIKAIRKLIASPKRWSTYGKNAREHYVNQHTVEAVLPQFEKVILDLKLRTK